MQAITLATWLMAFPMDKADSSVQMAGIMKDNCRINKLRGMVSSPLKNMHSNTKDIGPEICPMGSGDRPGLRRMALSPIRDSSLTELNMEVQNTAVRNLVMKGRSRGILLTAKVISCIEMGRSTEVILSMGRNMDTESIDGLTILHFKASI